MLVVNRFVEPDEPAVLALAREAVDALRGRPGFRRAQLARAVEDDTRWVLVSEWDGLGAWRRAISSSDVKMRAWPLLARAVDEPSAYEPVEL